MSNTKAVVLAGGKSRRMGKDRPKQFLMIKEKPIIIYTLEKFDRIDKIDSIVLVVPRGEEDNARALLDKYALKKKIKLVPGGRTRQISSRLGLEACGKDTSLVAIHDAARPFVKEELIEELLTQAEEHKAVTCAGKCRDTIACISGGMISKMPPRERVMRIQTPQVFHYGLILKAHYWAEKRSVANFTDDCGIVFHMGEEVKIIETRGCNMKITEPSDLFMAERMLLSHIERGV